MPLRCRRYRKQRVQGKASKVIPQGYNNRETCRVVRCCQIRLVQIYLASGVYFSINHIEVLKACRQSLTPQIIVENGYFHGWVVFFFFVNPSQEEIPILNFFFKLEMLDQNQKMEMAVKQYRSSGILNFSAAMIVPRLDFCSSFALVIFFSPAFARVIIILNVVKYANSYQILCFSKGEQIERTNEFTVGQS